MIGILRKPQSWKSPKRAQSWSRGAKCFLFWRSCASSKATLLLKPKPVFLLGEAWDSGPFHRAPCRSPHPSVSAFHLLRFQISGLGTPSLLGSADNSACDPRTFRVPEKYDHFFPNRKKNDELLGQKKMFSHIIEICLYTNAVIRYNQNK